MKFSTLNLKSADYNENHIIYIGLHTGSFKKLEVFDDNPHKQTLLQKLDEIDKTSKITCMDFGHENGSEILIGNMNHFVKVFDCTSDSYSTFLKLEGETAPVVGLGRYNECIIAASETGDVQVVKYPKPITFSVGDNLAKMRLCQEDRRFMVTGGKTLKNILKVWDINTKEAIFCAKNVKKDMLELEQPVWESDVLFMNRNCVASCSRHGYVRVYDMRGQARRPVQSFSASDVAFTSLASNGAYLYAGTATMGARAFDTRQMKSQIHTYKGFSGTVTSLSVDKSGKYLFSACLDRYTRVHSTDRPKLLHQCYVKSKPTAILYRENVPATEDCILVEDTIEEKDEEYEELFSKMDTIKENSASKKRKLEED